MIMFESSIDNLPQSISLFGANSIKNSVDNEVVAPFADVMLSDTDQLEVDTLIVTLSNVSNGALNDPSQGLFSNGTLTVSGSAMALQSIIHSITFMPSSKLTSVDFPTITYINMSVTGPTGQTSSTSTAVFATFASIATSMQSHGNDLSYAPSSSGINHFIDLSNFEASFTDLIIAFGSNSDEMSAWYTNYEPIEHRVATFDGLDYVASYTDLRHAFATPGASEASIEDAGAHHYITYGSGEGRTTTFNGLDYIASYKDLTNAFGSNSDAGAMHFLTFGAAEGRTTTFDGLDYIASYRDLIAVFGANEQSGANHFISYGSNEGRTTTFDGLAYIANYSDLMIAFGANNDAGATQYIDYGLKEGRTTSFNVQGYEAAHPNLQGIYTTNDQFLAAYINTYVTTQHLLT